MVLQFFHSEPEALSGGIIDPDVGGRVAGIIVSQGNSAGILNQSGYTFDQNKANDMPGGWLEVDGYSETWEEDNNTAVRVFNGPWGTRKQFIDWALGFAWNDGGTLRRVLPAQHPEYYWLHAIAVTDVHGIGAWRNNPNVFQTDANGNPLTGNTDPNEAQEGANEGGLLDGDQPAEADEAAGYLLLPMIAYYGTDSNSDDHSCTLKVTYRALDFEIYDDATMAANSLTEVNRWVEREEDHSLRTLTIPGFTAQFAPNADGTVDPIPENALLVYLANSEVVYTWRQVPDFPAAAIEVCRGCVNQFAFDPQITVNGANVGGYNTTGYAPETLIFLNAKKKRRRSPTGRVWWDIQYRFLYQPVGWNFFPHLLKGTTPAFRFDRATTGGNPIFPLQDFGQLFTQPNPAVNYQGANG